MATRGVIDRFKASVLRTGLARAARYEVVIHPPPLLTQLYGDISNLTRNVGISCDTIALPGHDLNTHSAKYGTGLAKEMVTGHKFEGTIAATFYLDTEMKTKMFFDAWQQLAVHPETNKVSYYKDYIGSMDIFQLGSKNEPKKTNVREQYGVHPFEESEQRADRMHYVTDRAYGIHAIDVYPETIGQIEYAYATVDTVALLPVEFQYRRWKTVHPDKLYE